MQYLDPRLAAVYDALNPPDATTEFFGRLLAGRRARVLDLGCGTGQLALQLAAAGHTVTGADPAAPMLDIARLHDRAGQVEWIAADARTLALDRRFDGIMMTGHVFQIFAGDAEIAAVLERARAHLVPGGFLAFDTRNPRARAWERWTPQRSRREVEVPALGRVTVSYDVRELAGDIVRFVTHYEVEGGDTITSESSLRFLAADALIARLAAAGFARTIVRGDWDGSPFTDASPEILVQTFAA